MSGDRVLPRTLRLERVKIADHIADLFRERLHRVGCLVVYDPTGRYWEIALGLDGDECRVIDAAGSAIFARETAMRAWVAIADGEKRLLVHVPAPKPLEEEDKQADSVSPARPRWCGLPRRRGR